MLQGKAYKEFYAFEESYLQEFIRIGSYNIWGSSQVPSIGELGYFVTFIDDYS